MPVPSSKDAAAEPSEITTLQSSFAAQGLELIGTSVQLDTPPSPPRSDGTRATPGSLDDPLPEAMVELHPEEEAAAVLTIEDGYYAWHFATENTLPAEAPPIDNVLRTRDPIVPDDGAFSASAPTPGFRLVRIPLRLGTVPQATQPLTRGPLTDLVVTRVQVLVFKFAGRHLLRRFGSRVDEKCPSGIRLLRGETPASAAAEPLDWPLVQPGDYTLPSERAPRILLFVHGTFSSTIGGFGALAATPWGNDFLAAARAGYDALLAFDHPTLTVNPRDNAIELLSRLREHLGDRPAVLDIVCHSRGGLVVRSLIEDLLPGLALPWRVERTVFVGATNGGTQLANPKNWRELMELYTNLAAAAGRLLGRFPATTVTGVLIAELTRSIGLLVQILASEAIDNNILPGLAAMEPDGAFVRRLNQTQPGQATAAQSLYYAVTSDFSAKLAQQPGSDSGLPKRLLLLAADRAVDRLMGESNDLVVNVAAMTEVDPHAGVFVKDTLAFASNAVVYHTNYFLQPKVLESLARWLRLPPPAATPASLPAGLALRGLLSSGTNGYSAPARFDPSLDLASADAPAHATLQRLENSPARYLVVERHHEGRLLRYAFTSDEVRAACSVAAPGATLHRALNLHEFDASPTLSAHHTPTTRNTPPAPPQGAHPTTRRLVALDGDQVSGVAEAELEPTPFATLITQACLSASSFSVPTSRGPLFDLKSLRPPAHAASAPPSVRSNPPAPPAPPVPPSSGASVSPAPGGGGQTPAAIACHIRAEMDDLLVLNETTSVDVTLSREALGEVLRAVHRDTTAQIQPDLPLILEVIPRKNLRIVGASRQEFAPPALGAPVLHCFDIRPTDVGEGLLLVRVRQGSVPFANLTLAGTILAARGAEPVRRTPEQASVVEPTPSTQPLHQLTIFEAERGGQKYYQFIFDSPSLSRKDRFESPDITTDLVAYTRGLYDDIEKRWLGSHADVATFQRELRVFGATLWDRLLPRELQALLWQHRDAIDEILVFAEEPFIPWELVHLKDPDTDSLPSESRFLGQMGLVRWLHNNGWPTGTLRARPGRCHHLIPRYPHPQWHLPEAEKEAAYLIKTFQSAEVVPHEAELTSLLNTPAGFDLLHFACHGVAESGEIARAELMLEGRLVGTPPHQTYSTERFRVDHIEHGPRLDHPTGGVRPIIVINACQVGRAGYHLTSIGGFARAFLRKGVGLFVAASWAVGDQPARTFTETLYARLVAGDTLAQATVAAREAARKAGDATWLAYTVYGNPRARLTATS
ncbi:hypothetical protein OpiT1DRAFT_03279 [Opitutaceae bacterium TAV1]|nr:hypothetical protein OpiT1DRAFT_03279 [Opitutaceae bacterium TAV1]